ncbi:OmpA family protein [Cytophaga aurantiaca]|uniref:OmpA family protein n=1 Tax=Cytophaga aurantiaca TaxID=29530 RepID=UPI00035D3649|nr:OmpA family protein [Cytophaga aurantiaca]
MGIVNYGKRIIAAGIFVFLFAPFYVVFAQTAGNCIPNGSFELGNVGFESGFSYSDRSAPPGYYSVTDHASQLNKDFKDPDGGDHTEAGYGMYMVVNSDGRKIQAWCSKVTVLPNSEYDFSVFFCNIYRLLPPKTNFAFENGDVKGNDPKIKVTIGNEELVIERDFYHMFKWIKASAIWYSGEHSGPLRICIENLNTNERGNDLALDDISLIYIRTMPEGYKPPEKIPTVMHRDYKKTPVARRKVPLSEYGIEFDNSDTLNQGVYKIHYKKEKPVDPEIVEDTTPAAKIERVILKDILFVQSRAELLPQAKLELDRIAEWMNRDTNVRVRFIGHTDNQGDTKLNVALSEARVSNVKKYLISKGIAADRIETVGYGGAFPIADNTKEETRKLNRRVEMEIIE